jgi:hypothetical protein
MARHRQTEEAMRALVIAVALVAVLPATAAAKTGLSLDPPPNGLRAGNAWEVNVEAFRNDAWIGPRPGSRVLVRITSEEGGATYTFPAHQTPRGIWHARVVFPRAGRWDYSVHGFGDRFDHQFWDPVTIARKPAARQTAKLASAGDASFLFGWVGAAAAVALLAAGLVARRLRS